MSIEMQICYTFWLTRGPLPDCVCALSRERLLQARDCMSTSRPNSLVRALASVGPGLVVAGSVMGSGELINTPAQAATFGFLLLWAVLLSCVIKYFLQIEIGRYCLVNNRTTVEALNQCPGPKYRRTSWTALLYM